MGKHRRWVLTIIAQVRKAGDLRRFTEGLRSGGQFPAAGAGNCFGWWRRGDSKFRGFRHGLDYAFIHRYHCIPWMRSVLSGLSVNRILVPTQGNDAVGEPMSLYRAGLRLALFLPLGVAMPPS